MPRGHPILLVGLCGLSLIAGCASNEYISLRLVPKNPLADQLNLLSFSGPKLTERTTQLLRRYDLGSNVKYSPEALQRLLIEIRRDPSPEKFHACAELAYVGARTAERYTRSSEALDLYGVAVAHAYWYLFDPRFEPLRNPYDPQFRGACDLYNSSLESAIRLVQKQGNLRPGSNYSIQTERQTFDVTVKSCGKWHPEDFDRLEFASNYEIIGLTNRHQTYGLGVPMIAIRKPHGDQDPDEAYLPPGLSFAVTAFLRVLASPNESLPDGAHSRHHCVLELHDPLEYTDIRIRNESLGFGSSPPEWIAPLETDITTSLAHLLDSPSFKENKSIATLGLLNPNRANANKGLFMLEPFDPNRIPVLMVHGLWSSPTTWMEMFNDLRSFPEIRERYQFWFYLYASGQPFWVSAKQLRQDLAVMRQRLDPYHQSLPFDRMVLVGHSMGGLVSRMQIVDSGDQFWRLVTDRPFEELKADGETRNELASTFFFQANPSIGRVITIGTPHRGSEFANDFTRYLGRKVISLPAMMMQSTQRVIRQNPGYFRDTEMLTITTSIDSLAPDSPILPLLAAAPRAPWVQQHNIVGIVPDDAYWGIGSIAKDGDGVVKRASAQFEGADSEIAVPANHISVHQHPRSILEVRRILLEHEQQFLAEFGGQLANYANPQMLPAIPNH